MSRYPWGLVGRKTQQVIALFFIFCFGLLGIIASGGGGGGGNGGGDEPGTLQFSTNSYSGNEDAGAITITVTRVGGDSGTASVDVLDAGGGSATSGTDYTAISTTTLNWADGDSSSKTISVTPIADGTVESNETVMLALDNATGATLGSTTSATVTILNDDSAGSPGTLQFSASSYSVSETSASVTITVTRIGGTAGAVGVSYATSNGSANAGSDYTATSGTLSWADGISTSQTFNIPIIDDTDVEVPETVNLALSAATGGATLGSPKNATLTINSDDQYGTLKFSATSYNVSEGDGTVSNVIALQRVNGSSGAVSVDVSVTGGTASGSGVDYTFASPTTVTWSDGDTVDKYVTITLEEDLDPESTETVILSMGNVVDATIGTPSSVTVNIADNDAAPDPGALQFDAATYYVDEAAGTATITVNRINGTSGAVGVDYTTGNNTATAGSDYTTTSGALSWADGEGGAKTFSVPILDDTDIEGNETLTLSLLTPTGGATLGTQDAATLVIVDDDTNLTMYIGDGTYWVAFQDGPSGSWAVRSPSSGNQYDFPILDASGRYGVAYHVQEQDLYSANTVEKTYVILATVDKLNNVTLYDNEKFTVSGTLNHFSAVNNDTAYALMHLSGTGDEYITLPYTYTLPLVASGYRDLFAIEMDTVDPTNQIPGKFVIRRNINVLGDLTGQDVDFAAEGEQFIANDNDFIGGVAGQLKEVYYSTDNGTVINLTSEIYNGVDPVHYPYITNASMTQAGDAYSFRVSNPASGNNKYRIRNQVATSDPGTQDIGLGNLDALTGTLVTNTQVSGLDYIPNPASFTNDPRFRGYQIDLDQTVTGVDGGAHWQFKVSTEWLGSSTSYTYPDLSALSGYDASWDLASGIQTDATVAALTAHSGTGLSLIVRKTTGRNSNNMEDNVLLRKLATSPILKLDVATERTIVPSW